MAGLTSAGIGSGLDVDSLVTKLMAVEKQPLTALDTKEADYNAKLSAFGTLKSALSSLQTAAKALNTPEKLSPIKASVGDSTVLAATTGSGATVGSYNVEVTSLAKPQKLMSAGFASTSATVGTGTITLNFGTYATTASGTTFTANSSKTAKTITIDSSNNTLSGIRDAINSANAGVTASIINDGTTSGNRLVITSNDSGTANALKIGVSENAGSSGLVNLAYDATGAGTSNLSETQGAVDAVIKVDSVTIIKPSNTITDAIEGVTLSLTKLGSTTVTLNKDTTAIQSSVEAFVKAFNDVTQAVADATAYDATTKKSGVLIGDSTVQNIRQSLRSMFHTPVAGASTGASTLADIGVSFEKDGTLSLDTTKLKGVLGNPNKDIAKLFAYNGTANGYGVQMERLIGRILSPVGTLAARTTGINKSITNLDTQRDVMNTRLAAIEKNYRAQFTALDTLVASMTSTSSFLTQQLSILQKTTSSSA
ncbi:MAG: flagellar filament capping protein FliD [Rhodocyclaceae bacterium]